VVRSGKTFGIGLALLSMIIAPTIANAPDGLFGYLQEINGCYTIPILTIILVGYLTKYVPALAAKVAMLIGVVMYSISQFVLKDYVISGGGEYPHYLHIMAIIFLFNIGVMLLIGKLRPREVAYVQNYTEQVDITPWKPVKMYGIIITIIVISTYFIFT
jgi:SSS family solute:Na+ symporter